MVTFSKKTSIFLLLFQTVSPLYSQRGEVSPVSLNRISGDLFEITGGRGARGAVYIGDNGVLVVDAKMDEASVDQTLAEIRKLTDKTIKYLVNTHSDGDHIAGNRYFPRTITFIAHENCREDFFRAQRDGTPSEWSQPDLMPYVPSITFREHLNIYLGSKKVELWYFGVGHTTGDAVVYFPKEKTAVIGDLVFKERPQLIHSHKNGNSFEYVETMTRLLETLDAEKFCSGHSEVLDREAIITHIQEMKERQKKVKTLKAQNKTLDEIKDEFAENEDRLIESIYNEIE